MPLAALIMLKAAIIALVMLFHALRGRHFKAILLGILLYIAIPDGTDLIIQPIFAQITGLAMPWSIIVYFGIVWLVILAVWVLM